MDVFFSNATPLNRNNAESLEVISNFFRHRSDELHFRFSCPMCRSMPSSFNSNGEGIFQSYVQLICNHCMVAWNLCTLCPCSNQYDFVHVPFAIRARSSNDLCISELSTQMKVHQRIYHNNAEHSDNESFPEDENEFAANISCLESMIAEVFPSSDNSDVSAFNSHIRKCLYEKHSSKAYGEFLVKKYWMKNEDCSISSEDVQTFLRMVRLLRKSSRDENEDLSKILEGIVKQKDKQYLELSRRLKESQCLLGEALNAVNVMADLLRLNDIEQTIVDIRLINSKIRACLHPEDATNTSLQQHDSSVLLNVPFPIASKDMRRVLEGKLSFLHNIPCPPIYLHNSGYAYVLPSDILKLSVCFGTDIEIVRGGNAFDRSSLDSRSVYHSPAIQKIVTDENNSTDCIIVVYGMWSDGCYCGTESKGRRNTAKMITIHIAHHNIKREHVFPIALGRTKDSDDDVKRIIIEDMSMLNTSTQLCFIPSLNKSMNVAFRLGYIIQDRPEHAETTGFMSSSGTFSKKVGFSCPIEVSKNNFIANTGRQDAQITSNWKTTKQISSCSRCFEARLNAFTSNNYNQAAASSRRCGMCYDWSLHAVEYSYPNNFSVNDVPPNDISGDYLKTKKISFRSMKQSCEIIFRKVYLKEWTKNQAMQYSRRECIRTAVVEDVYQTARQLRQGRRQGDNSIPPLPEKILPPFWNQSILPIEHFMLGLMHYLFLNVGNHVLVCIKDKLSDDNMWTSTHLEWNVILQDIRSLSLDWCKAWMLASTDKPASMWVSENYFAFSIVGKSLATSIRGLNGGQTYEYVRLIEDTLSAYAAVVNMVMSPEYPNDEMLNRVDAAVKLFLSFVEDLDNNIVKETENKIESASCFVNLLGLKENMELFGVLRNFWEGGLRGEGIFLPLKESINRGFHSRGLCKRVLQKQYHAMWIDKLMDFEQNIDNFRAFNDAENDRDDVDNIVEQSDDFDKDRYRKYHCYNNKEAIATSIELLKPLALVYYKPSKDLFCFIGKRRRNKVLQKMSLSNIENDVKATMVFDLLCDEEPVPLNNVSNDLHQYISCIALPLTFCFGVEDAESPRYIMRKKYYVISEFHRELSRNKCFVYPSIMKNERNRTDVPNHHHLLLGIQRLTDEERQLCASRDWCTTFVNSPVRPIENTIRGTVTSFSYRGGHVTPHHATWKVKYYNNTRRTAVRTMEYCFWDLKEILLT